MKTKLQKLKAFNFWPVIWFACAVLQMVGAFKAPAIQLAIFGTVGACAAFAIAFIQLGKQKTNNP